MLNIMVSRKCAIRTAWRSGTALLLCTTGMIFAAPALAQQSDPVTAVPGANPPAAQPPAKATDQGIADIVVTARFRSETLQNTPVAVSALNAKTLSNSVVTDMNSIQKFLPNVQLSRINYAGQALGASIRGISFADLEKTFDPTIGIAIDGVFLGTNTGANINFNDIESIEVLRGPQGTLYGRNTIGGTISVRRTTPTGILGSREPRAIQASTALTSTACSTCQRSATFSRSNCSACAAVRTPRRATATPASANPGATIIISAGARLPTWARRPSWPPPNIRRIAANIPPRLT